MHTTSEENGTSHIYLGSFYKKVTAHCIKWRWVWLLAVILVTAAFASQFPKVRFDNSSDIWFVEGHKSLESKAVFDNAFGNDEYVHLFFLKEETPFTPESLRLISELEATLETDVAYARKVTWLGNVERIHTAADGSGDVLVEDFMAEMPSTQEAVDSVLQEALAEEDYVNNLISPDATVLVLSIELDPYPEDGEDVNPRNTVAKSVYEVLKRDEYKGLSVHVAGSPVFSYEYEKLVKKGTSSLFLLVVVVQAFILLWLGRGPRGVIVPLVVTVLAVLWTIGSMGLLGMTMNLLSVAMPTMLICVSIGDAMHGITAFHDHIDKGLARLDALKAAFAEVGGPIMLTSLTTAAGFLAYLTTQVKPYREMGIYVALGVLYAFILTLILVPVFYSFGKERLVRKKKRSRDTNGGDIFDKWLSMTHRVCTTRPKTVAGVFLVVMAVTFAGYLMVKVESNTSRLVFKRVPLRQTIDLLDGRMGTAYNLEFMFDTEREDGIKDPKFMAKLEAMHQYAENHPLVTKASSVTHVVKKMRQALHNNDPAYYALPESAEAIAQYLFMYEASGGANLDRQVGFTYDVARLSMKLKSLDTGQARQLNDDMEAKVTELFGDDVKMIESGSMFRYIALNDILFEGQRTSFLAALLTITIIMTVVLRSVKLGLISLAPNAFPVFLTMGFMGLAGFYLDVITISFAAVIIGVAVDDTIHFFTRFKAEFLKLGNYKKALGEALATAGRPITFTSIVLVLGNSVLMTSDLLGFFKLGLLFGVAFITALVADFFFATSLIMIFKPLGPESNPEAIDTQGGENA